MSMTEWAEREVAAACKRENPNWDGKSFDYGCSCYQSALKAYKLLMKDGHSEFSCSMTRNILKKLLDEIPLSPITDDDFITDKDRELGSDEHLKERGLKSRIQCPRRSSLFREEDLEGNIKYVDIDRRYCVDAESPSHTFLSSVANFIDDFYPIRMPYTPSSTPFKVYVNTWLTNKAHGDFDVQEVIGYRDQNNIWHNWNIFLYHDDNGTKEITSVEEKYKLRNARIDNVKDKIAASLINDINDMFLTDELWKQNRSKYDEIKAVVHNVTKTRYSTLQSKCYSLAKRSQRDICYLNTYRNHRIVVNGSDDERNELIEESLGVKGLIDVVDDIKHEIKMLIKNQ